MDTTKTYGAKYNSELTRTQIAALIRADIKAALRSGELPVGLKCLVRKHASSIHLTVVAVPAGFRIQSDTALRGEFGPNRYRHTEEARALLDKLSTIHGAYNYDGSDIQSDYFNVNYYGSATFGWVRERWIDERNAERACAALPVHPVREEQTEAQRRGTEIHQAIETFIDWTAV